jgi:hypothetical protein
LGCNSYGNNDGVPEMFNSSTKIEVVGDLDFFLSMMEEASFVNPHRSAKHIAIHFLRSNGRKYDLSFSKSKFSRGLLSLDA